MNIFIRQLHNDIIEFSFRKAVARREEDRVIVVCPETDNILINCSVTFFNKEIDKGRILSHNKF